MKLTQYKLLQAETAEDLEVRVEQLLSDGWKCQGGVACYQLPSWHYPNLYQAMIRPVDSQAKAQGSGNGNS